MRKEVADLWVKELRSKNWKQGRMYLEHSNTYCVMGILANIAGTFGIVDKRMAENYGKIAFFDGNMLQLPDSVVKWSGMKSELGIMPGLKYSLIEYNDQGKSFEQLAEWIEKHWKSL
jgi:hypothetical protein